MTPLPSQQHSRTSTSRLAAARVAASYLVFAALWIYASDRVLGLLVQDKVWLAWIGTIKGLVFALVTALLLYLLLRAWGQRDAEHQAEPAAPQSKRLVAVFALLALLFPLLIFGAVHLESARIRQEAQGDLNTIAQLKTGQIEQWLAERRGDAAVLMASDGFIDEVNLWFQIGDHNAKAQVDQRLEAMTRAFGYQTELLDTKLHSGNAIRPATLTAALKTRQVQMSELYRDNAGRVWLDFVVPLFKHAPSLRAVGAVVLHAPAGQFLFPLLQTWPTPSPSAEFLLLRREGNSILFLNELRHRKNTALNFRLPLDAPNLPAAIAARSGSKAQIIAGRDYRGVPVLTAVRPVRGTSWFLVAKVDEDELMAPLRQLVAWVSMIAFAAFATVAAVVILLWRQQQRAHQLELLARTSKAVRDSEQRLAGLVDSAMDAIIAIDDSQRIVLFNPAAEEMFGLSAIQARGQPLDHLLPEAFRHVHAEHIREFGRTAITSRTVQSLGTLSGLRANGEEFPIEASISQSAVEGGKLYTVILRDITERRRSEALLRASEAQFRAIFEVSSVGMCQADPSNGKLVQVNRRFCEMTGYSEEELLGRPFLDILHPDDRTQSFAGFSRLVRGEIPEYRREERHSCKDGLVIWTDVTANVIHDSHLIPWRTIAIVQDITERKQAEETLRASEEKFRSLVEQASDGIFVSDAHGNYTEVNSAGCAMLGYTRDELLALNIADVVAQEEIPRIPGEVARFAGGGVVTSEWLFRRKNASVFVGEVAGRQLPDGRLQAIVRNITERKVAEQALRYQLLLTQSIAEKSTDSIFVNDAEGRVTFANPEAERVFGYTAEELIGRHLHDVVHHSTVDGQPYPMSECPLCLVYRTGEVIRNREALFFRKDGTPVHVTASNAALESEGTLLGAALVLHDVTERKAAEAALREREDDLTRAQAVGHIGSWRLDARRNELKWSAENHRIFGIAEGTPLSYETLLSSVYPDDRNYVDVMWDSGMSGKPCDIEYRIVVDGKVKWVRVKAEPEFDNKGGLIGAFGTTQDITERKQAELALQDVNQRKDEFLALLAHELRNPMAVIVTAVYLLQNKGLTDPETRKWATATISSQTDHLKRLVDDLLDVARIGRGKIALQKTQFDLVQLLGKVAQACRPLVDKRQQHFSLNLSSSPVWIEADSARLTQVVTNLLENAIKFTPANGSIELSLRAEGNEAVICVRDTGRGIAPEFLPGIFDTFTQGEVSLARDEGGLGLGLAIVKKLTEYHGGNVTAASEGRGKGAEFSVRLPALPHPPKVPARPAAEGSRVCKRRILIGEDNAAAGEAMVEVLRHAGHSVRLAQDGEAALAAAKAELPEIAIFDIGLPAMDGFALARSMRKLAGGKRLLLIALTGYGQAKYHTQSRSSGFDYHIVKPADIEQLLGMINAWEPLDKPEESQ